MWWPFNYVAWCYWGIDYVDDKISKESFLPKVCILCSPHRSWHPFRQTNVQARAHHWVAGEEQTLSSNPGPAASHPTGPSQVPPHSPEILPHTPPGASQTCQTLSHLPALLSTWEMPSSLSSVWSNPHQTQYQLLNTTSPATAAAACRALSSPPPDFVHRATPATTTEPLLLKTEIILSHRHILII